MNIKEQLDNIIGYAKRETAILALILFGSYARNENFNDIDIAIVLYPKEKSRSNEIIIDISSKFPDIFDFSIFSRLPLYIQNRVRKEGKIIFNDNFDELFDIYEKNIKDYNDFKPHFDVFLEVD